jgi:Tetratricopeptide repeat
VSPPLRCWRRAALPAVVFLAAAFHLRAIAQVPAETPRPNSSVVDLSRLPPGIRSLVEAFDRNDRMSTQPELRQNKDLPRLLRQVMTAGNPWPNVARREAVFALEIASVAVTSDDEAVHAELTKFLEHYSAIARPARPPHGAGGASGSDGFECVWHWGLIAAFEGAFRPVTALGYVSRALERCPDEPRFLMAQAVLTDQRWPILTVTQEGRPFMLPLNAGHSTEILSRYQALMARPETRAEARVRTAWFLYRSTKYSEALELLNDPSLQAGDAAFQYIGAVVRGRTLRALGQFDAAASAFRAALTAWPGGQSARVALMTLVVAHGDRHEAETLAEAIQSASNDVADPWWWYWQGDFHLYRSIVNRLRDAVR